MPDDSHEDQKRRWMSDDRLQRYRETAPKIEPEPTAFDRILARKFEKDIDSGFASWWAKYGRFICPARPKEEREQIALEAWRASRLDRLP